MNWEILIVLLIPLAVWIISSIFGGGDERADKNRADQAGKGQPQDGRRLPARTQNELDRFLEETRRRREPGQARKVRPAESADFPAALLDRPQPPVPPPAPPLPPAPPPPVVTPRRPAEQPRRVAEQPRSAPAPRRQERMRQPASAQVATPRYENLAVSTPPGEPLAAYAPTTNAPGRPTFDLPESMQAPEAPALPAPTTETPATPADRSNQASSPMLNTIAGMLRDRNALAAAFILREILDRPLCMRRGEARSSRQG